MKRLLLFSAAAALLAGPALAQDATVDTASRGSDYENTIDSKTDLEKNVWIDETVNFDVKVNAEMDVDIDADKFAESSAVADQESRDNGVGEQYAVRKDELRNSASENQGILSVNQASGNANSQGTLVSVAIDSKKDEHEEKAEAGGFAHAQAHASQVNAGSSVQQGAVSAEAKIANALNNNTGLAFANQAAGNVGNQVNVLSMAFAMTDTGVALADADLGQVNRHGQVGLDGASDPSILGGATKSASINGSLNNNVGVFGVNQSAGNMANQANVVAVAAVGSQPTL